MIEISANLFPAASSHRSSNLAFVSLADGVSHDDNSRQSWTGMALLQ